MRKVLQFFVREDYNIIRKNNLISTKMEYVIDVD